MPSKLIIDFNRCFEPNPFNTGPSIPSKHAIPLTPLLSHVALPDIQRGDTPDLTASPSSSVSSVLPLESEEIKRIFSFPAYDRLEVDAVDPPQRFSLFEQYGLARSAEFYQSHAPFPHLGPELYQARVDGIPGSPKEKLNPHAAEFVPTFSKPLRNHIEPDPEPLDIPLVGFQAIPLPENVPPPPGLPHPPAFLNALPSPHPADAQLAPCLEPPYFPLLMHASFENTTSQERADLMCTLVRSKEHWTIERLLELARHISVGALFPGDFLDERGAELPACAPSRYVPVQPQLTDSNIPEANEQMRPEDILADMTKHLHDRFKEWRSGECAQAFLWNVRELVLVQFKQSWDSANPLAVNFQSCTTPVYVRSCLALCRSIAAFFRRGLFTHRNIDACVKILLQGLISVEYAEALVTLVLACGPEYLNPEGEPPLGEYQRLASLVDGIRTSPTTSQLSDDTSVVCQPWGQGQLQARLSHLTESLKGWAEGWANAPRPTSSTP